MATWSAEAHSDQAKSCQRFLHQWMLRKPRRRNLPYPNSAGYTLAGRGRPIHVSRI